MMKVHQINAFNDNYIWLLGCEGQPDVAIVDPGDATPVINYLQAHGLRAVGKTTGDQPAFIEPNGSETRILRKLPASIAEQAWTIRQSARRAVDALVIECMAIRPEYQRVSERSILRSDIGVLTNVRPDHLDQQGQSLPGIAMSLCSGMPQDGVVFTAPEGGAPWSGRIASGRFEVEGGAGGGRYDLLRVERRSTTEGLAPPDGAVVLLPFAPGKETSLDAWRTYLKHRLSATSLPIRTTAGTSAPERSSPGSSTRADCQPKRWWWSSRCCRLSS